MRNDRKKYIMKRRRYGYGWTPTTWQAWVLIGAQLAIILTAAMTLPAKPAQPSAGELIRFTIIGGSALTTIILISYLLGPSPKWRWGKKGTDNHDTDF
ncbi:MAG: hypothetical protein ABIR91_02775 [Candidatus Saccharimonadales bacterium]